MRVRGWIGSGAGTTVCAAAASFLLAVGVLAAPAWAERDAVHFAESIDVKKGSAVHDAVCFFCSVRVHGEVKGDIVAFFGSVRIDGEADHDVVDFFGGVQVADNSSIGHDLVNFFGGVRLGENASVGRDLVEMFGGLRAAATAKYGGDRVVFPAWIFWGPVAVVCGVIWWVLREVRWLWRRRLLRGY